MKKEAASHQRKDTTSEDAIQQRNIKPVPLITGRPSSAGKSRSGDRREGGYPSIGERDRGKSKQYGMG